MQLAEQVLQVLRAPEGGGGVRAEAGVGGDLEDVAQPLGGDPHVVQRGDLGRVERLRDERPQLVETHVDDALGVVRERRRGIEALDLARLHAAASGPAAPSPSSAGTGAASRGAAGGCASGAAPPPSSLAAGGATAAAASA